MKKEKVKKKQSATRSIALGFALIIFVGAIMLTLPIATRTGEVNFIASLFTATSATCVTGLVVADTYQNWSVFGQIVVITMIQLGGLGFMTRYHQGFLADRLLPLRSVLPGDHKGSYRCGYQG